MHHPSQVEFVLPCVAFFRCDLKEEEEGEFKLELGGGGCYCLDVWASGIKRLIDITLLITISDSVLKNGPIQWLPLLPEREPQVLLGEGFLAQLTDALVLSDDETHVQQIRP